MGQPIEGSNPSLSATALTGPTDDRHAGPTSPSWWGTPRPRGRGYPPPIDLRLRVPVQDRRGPTDDRRGPTDDRRGPTDDRRGPTGALRGLWFLRPTRRVRPTGRIESS